MPPLEREKERKKERVCGKCRLTRERERKKGEESLRLIPLAEEIADLALSPFKAASVRLPASGQELPATAGGGAGGVEEK